MSIRDEARREYVRRAVGPSVGTIGDRLSAAWDAGAEWAVTREHTDAEVEAAARALHEDMGGMPDEFEYMHIQAARAALSAARAARRDEEKR